MEILTAPQPSSVRRALRHAPAKALARLQLRYELSNTAPSISMLADAVVLWFCDKTPGLVMYPTEARAIAQQLALAAERLERKLGR